MSTDPKEERLLDHEYDGIKEYDNPMPRWWLATFWVTIIFSILYVLNVPIVGIGKGRLADYEADMAEAAAFAAKNNPLANVTAEQVVTASTDPAQRALGSSTFATMCASCHLADGGGQIGPNLTDKYWLHGNQPLEIFKTVAEGVPAKGMPPWGKILKPAQAIAVSGYILTLQGAAPKTPKAPQGVNLDSVATAAAAVPPGPK